MSVAVLYWLQQISFHKVNLRMLDEISIKDYQIANALNADVFSNQNKNVST